MDVALTSIAMLAGICFGSVYERIRNRKRDVNLWKEFRSALTSGHFAISIIIAPLLFSSVYTAARAEPDFIVATMLAFQNGFFCERILKMGNQSDET